MEVRAQDYTVIQAVPVPRGYNVPIQLLKIDKFNYFLKGLIKLNILITVFTNILNFIPINIRYQKIN